MDAVLLAGGYGTRLQPLTYTTPKPLLPVAGRPMLEWALDRLPPEVDHVVVAVNWLAEKLEAHFRDSERDIKFTVVREAKPMGTAGAVKNCQQHLESEQFFVLNGDIVSDMDLTAMVGQHAGTNAVGTIALKEVPEAEVVNYGVIQPDATDPRRIRDFVEKPAIPAEAPSRRINAGAYLLNQSVIDLIAPNQMVSMEKEIFPQLLDDGFYGWDFDGTWIDVGDPPRLLQAHHQLGGASNIVGRNCQVSDQAYMSECILGNDVVIEANAYLTRCVVGDRQTVGGELDNERIWHGNKPTGYPEKQVGNAMPSPAPTQ
jgi:mannose-1-phosphate guanylyltransferase